MHLKNKLKVQGVLKATAHSSDRKQLYLAQIGGTADQKDIQVYFLLRVLDRVLTAATVPRGMGPTLPGWLFLSPQLAEPPKAAASWL